MQASRLPRGLGQDMHATAPAMQVCVGLRLCRSQLLPRGTQAYPSSFCSLLLCLQHSARHTSKATPGWAHIL
eukprot:365802-Chlamydomonas_euryale.AAC.7